VRNSVRVHGRCHSKNHHTAPNSRSPDPSADVAGSGENEQDEPDEQNRRRRDLVGVFGPLGCHEATFVPPTKSASLAPEAK
jgi:hypothetical protein